MLGSGASCSQVFVAFCISRLRSRQVATLLAKWSVEHVDGEGDEAAVVGFDEVHDLIADLARLDVGLDAP